NMRGLVCARQGRCDEALAAYNRALESAPKNAVIWSNKAHVLRLCERYDEALDACEQAVASDPGSPWPWLAKARLLEQRAHWTGTRTWVEDPVAQEEPQSVSSPEVSPVVSPDSALLPSADELPLAPIPFFSARPGHWEPSEYDAQLQASALEAYD